ncbi:MAG: HAMP domain-containing protein [Candidatus Riflebacteria bacterium]|nr:HAMP domain-containing protein [Candidatus Riflebacteria bacterium]
MSSGIASNKQGRTWLRLLPYFMLFLPLAVINFGFRFLANIELHWQERDQTESAQQELEALTRSSSFEHQLNRHARLFSEQITTAINSGSSGEQLRKQMEQFGETNFSTLGSRYKLHVFRKKSPSNSFDLIFARSEKVESKRAMSLIFDYMVALHQKHALSPNICKQRDKLAESYFGKSVRCEAYANSQKGKTSYILYNNIPHCFIWDYVEDSKKEIWGYFVAVNIEQNSTTIAQKLALNECRKRNSGLAGFIPLVDSSTPEVAFKELEQSALFKAWRQKRVRALDKNLSYWLKRGPPEPERVGNYIVYSYVGEISDHLTVFLAPIPKARSLPDSIRLANIIIFTLIIMLSLRGLLLNHWFEPNLSLRFLILYFLAATFPLGLLTVTAVAYHYQTSLSAQNKIASNLEACLKQFETAKMRIREEYQTTAQQLFNNSELAELIEKYGLNHELVRDAILKAFKDRDNPLPLVGFYLLDLAGKGLEYTEKNATVSLYDIFSMYRAPLIENLRKKIAQNRPETVLPVFKITEEEKYGAQAYDSATGNNFEVELDRRRHFCIDQKAGDNNISFIYDFLTINGCPQALLFFAWNERELLEKSIQAAIENFRSTYPDFSFIAFYNTPQGLKSLFKQEGEISGQVLSNTIKVGEMAGGRCGTVKQHMAGYSYVAMPVGANSEIVVVGLSSHNKIQADEKKRKTNFVILIIVSLLIAGLCAYLTAAFLLKPVSELKSALDRVSVGDYSDRLESRRSDELGKLTTEFASMVDGIKERERIAALLSDHAVEALTSTSDSTAECDAKAFTGIALVTDIRSFTTLCETYPTDEITEMLNHHFATMAEVIAANGGRIYKFIGDAIEAVFDEREAHATAFNAMKAAVEMTAALDIINQQRKTKGQFTYSSGVGLSRGTFYAGSVGSTDTRLDYSIIGENFNQAAQLEAMSKLCSKIPVVFDNEIADLVKDKINIAPIAQEAAKAWTIAGTDTWSANIAAEFLPESKKSAPRQQNAVGTADFSNPDRNFHSKYDWTAVILFAIFSIISAAGIYQGFVVHNEKLEEFNIQQSRAQTSRLIQQIKSENAAKVAFETKMNQLIKNIEKKLKFEYQPTEGKSYIKEIENAISELRKIGIETRRVYAISNRPGKKDQLSDTVFCQGIAENQKKYYFNQAQYSLLLYRGLEYNDLLKKHETQLASMFGGISPYTLSNENIGISTQMNSADGAELFYWNTVRVISEDTGRSLPVSNCDLANLPGEKWRIAGIVMFSVTLKSVINCPELIIEGYSEPGCEIALVSEARKIYHSDGFPTSLINVNSDNSAASENGLFLIENDHIKINKKPFRLVIARALPTTGQASLSLIAAVLAMITILLFCYVYRSVFAETAMSRSIQLKLIFSILLTSIIPLITVSFVSDFFLFENHQLMIQDQRLEIQHHLDSYEIRQFYNQKVAANLAYNLSMNRQIIALARQLDETPDSKEIRKELNEIFEDAFVKISADDKWESNSNVRNAILISRKNWEFYKSRKEDDKDMFSIVLSQVGKRILSRISTGARTDEFSMKDLKSEMFYDSAMQSTRSNFGNETYIKLTNTIRKLVEFEVTTGSAGALAIPLPSVENPDYILIWLITLTKGTYFTRIANQNRGPYAIFTIGYQMYGKTMSTFLPVPGLNLEKAAAWITSSNLPVSLELPVCGENVSIEGRAGIHQINNFIIGAGSQAPIHQATASNRQYLIYFILLALLIFMLIGFQTSSDIIAPVRSISEGMHQIGLQNYFHRISLDRNDELGQLCSSFDRFAKGLAEKEVMGKMLSRSARLAAAGSNEDTNLINNSKRSFVFVFIGSVDFAKRLSNENTEQLFIKLKNQVALLCRFIIEQGGDIDKLMGDKILGVFPYTGTNCESAQQAAISAVRQIMHAEQAGELNFPVAIGVNAGEVICGMLGFGAKRDFTVIGDAVNVSARIQKTAESMPEKRCLFSQDFVSGLTDNSAFKLHSEAVLKGKSATLKLYQNT